MSEQTFPLPDVGEGLTEAEIVNWLVAPGDASALAGGLTAVLADHARAAELVASGRERAETFSMDQLASRYLELYDRVVRPI